MYDDLFQTLVLNHLDMLTKNTFISKADLVFPQKALEFYIKRNLEELLWEQIKSSNKLLLSGWAGSGKTSLLLYTLCTNKQEAGDFDLIYVNYDRSSDNRSPIQIICDTLYRHYIRDFDDLYAYYLGSDGIDLFQLDLTVNDINLVDNNWQDNRQYLTPTRKNEIKHQLKDLKLRLKILRNYIFQTIEKKQYIVFDNIDMFTDIEKQKSILRDIRENIFPLSDENFKLIVAIRNPQLYNMISANANIDISVKYFPISIERQDKTHIAANDKFRKEDSAIFDIALKKIQASKKDENGTSESFAEQLKTTIEIFKNSSANLQKLLVARIYSMSNHSIRFALELLFRYSQWIQDNNLLSVFTPKQNDITLIHSFFYAWISNDDFNLAIQGLNPLEVVKAVENDCANAIGCDLEYLLLTYCLNNPNTTYKNLVDTLRQFVTIEEEEVKKALFKLFKRQEGIDGFGHVVFLYQGKSYPNNESEITDTTRIEVMPRAKAILETSYKFTFVNYILFNDSSKVGSSHYFDDYYKILDSKYIPLQYELLCRLYVVHLSELNRIALKHGGNNWIDRYKEAFSYNKKLQFEHIIENNTAFFKIVSDRRTNSDDYKKRLKAWEEKFEALKTSFVREYKSESIQTSGYQPPLPLITYIIENKDNDKYKQYSATLVKYYYLPETITLLNQSENIFEVLKKYQMKEINSCTR